MGECHISYVVQHVPLILQKVLELLPIRTLNSCARVCKEWNEHVKRIKKNRQKLEWMALECTESLDPNEEIHYLNTFTENLNSQPDHLLVFSSSHLYESRISIPSPHSSRFPRSAKCEATVIESYINKLMPRTCSIYGVSANGTVGTDQKTKKTSEMEDGDCASLSLLSIPHMEGLDICTFFVDINKFANDLDEGEKTEVELIHEICTIPEEKDVKVILFFCDEPACPPEIGYALLRQYPDCIVAGGHVDNLIAPKVFSDDEDSDNEGVMCMALCGPRVHAVSVVLHENINTAAEVEKIVKKLKDCNLPEANSVGFMFACVGRGKEHFKGALNVESSVFRKYFPNTPLFGFFGNGEVGFEHLKKYITDIGSSVTSYEMADKPAPKLNNALPKLYHAYTTIICLVSIV